MRILLAGVFASFLVSAAQAANPQCFPTSDVLLKMKEHDFRLTFEGAVPGVSGAQALQVFTEEGGEWFAFVTTDDGRSCPFAAGDTYNVTIGSLM